MIKELDTVVLTHDIKEYGLTEGDIGAVVHCYGMPARMKSNLSLPKGKQLRY